MAENETEVSGMTVQSMCDNPDTAAQELFLDPSAFEDLTLKEMKRVYGSVKRVSPRPEFKENFAWLKSFMKETMEGKEEADLNSFIDADPNMGTVEPSLVSPEVAAMADGLGVGAELEAMTETPPTVTSVIQAAPADGIMTKEQRDSYIFQLRDQGLKLKEIGAKVGLSGVRISRILSSK